MYPLEIRNKAIDMARSGKSIPQISEELGVLYNTIRVWVRGQCKTNRRSQETVDKAIGLAKQGYSKIEIARTLNVPVNTLYKWNLPQPTQYLEGLKQKAREMVLGGTSKILTAYKLGVSSKSVCNWTADIPRNKIPYPKSLKRKVRYLVKKGMTKSEVAEKLGLGYTTAVRWTTDIKREEGAVSGRYFLILCRLIKDGYVIASRKEIPLYKTLMKWVPLKSFISGQNVLYSVDKSKVVSCKSYINKTDNKK
jgi:hypothetical protein